MPEFPNFKTNKKVAYAILITASVPAFVLTFAAQPPAEDPEIKGFHPLKRLMAPVIRLGKSTVQLQPLTHAKGPLHEMNDVLVEMKGMITMALLAIVGLTLGIVFDTPIAAIFIYQHRRKIFPYHGRARISHVLKTTVVVLSGSS